MARDEVERKEKGPLAVGSGAAIGWLKIVGAYVAALTTFVLALTKLAEPVKELFPDAPNWLWLVVASLPLITALVTHGIPAGLQQRRKSKLENWGIKGGITQPGYFRVTPYEDTEEDRKRFARADRAHVTVLNWLEQTSETVLYLTGVSGVGKSSLLNTWVLPKLREASPPAQPVVVRSFHDPLEELRKELLRPGVIWERPPADLPDDLFSLLGKTSERLGRTRLLLVFDQFEEFLIIHDRDPERLSEFESLLVSIQASPTLGVQVLLVLRSDYVGMLQAHARDDVLPIMRQGVNWMEISAFLERDAREFLANSGIEIGKELMNEVFRQIREIEETDGLVRPITLNMVGLILDRAALVEGGLLQRRRHSSGLILDYLQDSIGRTEVRDHARPILRGLITKAGTKVPKSVSELATETSFTENAVTGCLLNLANRGLVRRIDAQVNVWEISHDFVARLLDRVLSTWREGAWQKIRPALLPVSLFVWLGVFLALPVLPVNSRQVKASDVTAELVYTFYFWESGPSPPSRLFDEGYELEIVGYRAGAIQPVDIGSGWSIELVTESPELYLRSTVENTQTFRDSSVDFDFYEQKSTFFQFTGDLGPFDDPAAWEDSLFEAQVTGYSHHNWWREADEFARDTYPRDFREDFFEFYGITQETRAEWGDGDFFVAPMPVEVELKLFVNGVLETTMWGLVAAVSEWDEDVRGLFVIRFQNLDPKHITGQ